MCVHVSNNAIAVQTLCTCVCTRRRPARNCRINPCTQCHILLSAGGRPGGSVLWYMYIHHSGTGCGYFHATIIRHGKQGRGKWQRRLMLCAVSCLNTVAAASEIVSLCYTYTGASASYSSVCYVGFTAHWGRRRARAGRSVGLRGALGDQSA